METTEGGLGVAAERIVALIESGNGQGTVAAWASLDAREQRVAAIETGQSSPVFARNGKTRGTALRSGQQSPHADREPHGTD